MDKERLEQYIYLKQEVINLELKITNIEKKLKKIEEGGLVIDSVRGGEGNQKRYKIEGFPRMEYEHVRSQLLSRRLQLAKLQTQDQEELKEIEKFMITIPDVMSRLIIQYRVIDRLDWKTVAKKLGGGNTSDSVRKQYSRIFNEKK